ncbi:hypothetical protein [Agrobacterium rosae]|uniref:Uncharacterized protein n=1 Tax=Agrobacterium rosae TaxID=1972867 RepID=A0A1R3T8V5_9HYPH|nr:hypothetical protein [Agrobacterium rosae]SCX02650.1 hypothetical protein DSM25559_0246 [Agrobacterium rosae]
MINTVLIVAAALGAIWQGGSYVERVENEIKANATDILRVERDQVTRWISHDDLHKNRLAEVKSVEARSDERFKGLEPDVLKLSGLAGNLNYRLTSNEQATSGIAQTVREIQQSLSQQSGDLREIKVILEQMEKGKIR